MQQFKIIEARHFDPGGIEKAYNRRSWLYDKIIAPLELKNHLLALKQAQIKPDDKILEVAVGPGRTFLEIIKKVERTNIIYGVDISEKMLKITQNRLFKHGYYNFELKKTNCRSLPFKNETFDLIYNGYMMDLMPINDIHDILKEFRRVLKPGGKLILLNMSKNSGKEDRREKLYRILPSKFVLYLAGGCRPVLLEPFVNNAGYVNVSRTFIDGSSASEIITALKNTF